MILAHVTDSAFHNAADIWLALGGAGALGGFTLLINYLKGKFMPCYTVSTVQVDLGKVNSDLLFSALKSLGLNPIKGDSGLITFGRGDEYHNPRTGETLLNKSRDVAELKRAYSAEVVKSQARKFGWQLKETGKYQYAVVKR